MDYIIYTFYDVDKVFFFLEWEDSVPLDRPHKIVHWK